MTIGQEPAPPWLETDWLLGQFHRQRRWAVPRYVDFVRAGVGLPSIWGNLSQQIFLGNERFIEKVKQQSISSDGNLREVLRVQRRPAAKPLAAYVDMGDRKRGMVEAYRTGDYTMQQIADAFCAHYATVSRAVRAAEPDG